MELLAYLDAGWHCNKDDEVNWQPIVHGDISEVNLFLSASAAGEEESFPRLLLGDWSMVNRTEDHTDRGRRFWKVRQVEDVKQLLENFLWISRTRGENISLELFRELVREGREWEHNIKENEGKSIMKYIVERFVPTAEAKIEELKAEEDLIFRDAMPGAMDGYMCFC